MKKGKQEIKNKEKYQEKDVINNRHN